MPVRIVSGKRLRELERFIDEVSYPSHCVNCPWLKYERPEHHSSYEVTARCNLNCVFCYAYSSAKAKSLPEPGYYGDENPEAVTVSQYGEPTLIGLEKLEKLFDLLRKRFKGVRIDLQTNGTLLTRPVKADIVMVSLSSSTEEGYARLTGRNEFHSVVRAVELSSSEGVGTIVRTVFLPGINSGEIESIARIAESLEVEHMIQPCSIHPGLKERLGKAGYIFENDTLYDYLNVAEKAKSTGADVRLPGCLLRIIRSMLEQFDFEDVVFLKRGFAERPPEIRREWKFSFKL